LFALSLFYSNSYLSAYANNFYYLILMSVMYIFCIQHTLEDVDKFHD